MMIECPHCHMETEHKVIDHINIDRNPELRAKVQDLSVFRVKCPNCGETVLAVHPCLYHDMANQFMVWLWTEDGQVPKAEFDPLAGYTLRVTDSLNTLYYRVVVIRSPLQGLCYNVKDAVDWFATPTVRRFTEGSDHSPLRYC